MKPKTRSRDGFLALGCATVIISIWIDKGLGMVVTGFIPSPLGAVTEYWPTWVEFTVALGIYSLGALILTVLYKVATTVGTGKAAH